MASVCSIFPVSVGGLTPMPTVSRGSIGERSYHTAAQAQQVMAASQELEGIADHSNWLIAAPAIVGNFSSALLGKIQAALTVAIVIWLTQKAVVGALQMFVSLRPSVELTCRYGIISNLDGVF